MGENKNGICRVVSIVLAVFNGLGILAFAFGMLYQRPKFLAIYADLEIALPVLTRLVIATPGGVVLFVSLVLLALLVAKEFIRRSIVPLVINLVWLVLGLATIMLVAMALMLPLATTVEHLSQ